MALLGLLLALTRKEMIGGSLFDEEGDEGEDEQEGGVDERSREVSSVSQHPGEPGRAESGADEKASSHHAVDPSSFLHGDRGDGLGVDTGVLNGREDRMDEEGDDQLLDGTRRRIAHEQQTERREKSTRLGEDHPRTTTAHRPVLIPI